MRFTYNTKRTRRTGVWGGCGSWFVVANKKYMGEWQSTVPAGLANSFLSLAVARRAARLWREETP